MVPYVIKRGDLASGHLAVFLFVVEAVNGMAENPAGSGGLTCHEVCDKLIKENAWLAENLKHVRGHFGEPGEHGRGAFEHSWLEFTRGLRAIIDPYPIACGSGPLLLFAAGGTPWYWLYVPEDNPKETFALVNAYTQTYEAGNVEEAEKLIEEHEGNIRLQWLLLRAMSKTRAGRPVEMKT